MAKFINQEESWDGAKICKVGEEIEKYAGDVIPTYLEPVDDEAKALKEDYEKSVADAQSVASSSESDNDDNSHDDVATNNPYKDLQNKTAVLAVCAERGIVPPASATRPQLEELLIADDVAKQANKEAQAQAQVVADAQSAAKLDALKEVAKLFDIEVEDSDTVETLQSKIEQKKTELSAPAEQNNNDNGAGAGTGTGEDADTNK